MNELVIQPGERILKEERDVFWLKGWFSKPFGRLCFTTQRLFFEVPKPNSVALSLSAAVQNEIANRVPIDIPRDRLEAVERGPYRKREALVVRTEDEEFRFLVGVVKEWEALLREAMHDDKVALAHVLEQLKPKQEPPPYR